MRAKLRFRGVWRAASLGALLTAGCAHYQPSPLPSAPDLTKTPALAAPAGDFRLPGLAFPPSPVHLFPKNGLDEVSVVTLAVFDNPDLKAARLQAGLADAQLLQAGLLPDPRVGAGFATSALNYGFNFALNEDIQALITRGAAKAGAEAHRRQVHLDILWQEWQVAERARESFIQSCADDRLRQVLSQTRDLFAERYRQDEEALRRNDLTLDAFSTDLTALTGAEQSLHQFEIEADATRRGLNQLLGLDPGAQLPLTGCGDLRPVSAEQFQEAVTLLPRRRVDLLALKAGYESQEQSVRQAVLSQFPSLGAGVEQGRDPIEGINYLGPNVTLTLPLFNRNRGQIAEQRATRAILRQTYQARIDQAVGDASRVWAAIATMQGQLRDLDARLPGLRRIATATELSFRQGNSDAASYVGAKSGLLAAQAQEIRLQTDLANANSVLNTLLGLPFGAP